MWLDRKEFLILYIKKQLNYESKLVNKYILHKKDTNYSNAQTLGAWDIPSQYTQMEDSTAATPIFQDPTAKYPLLLYSHGVGGEVLTT